MKILVEIKFEEDNPNVCKEIKRLIEDFCKDIQEDMVYNTEYTIEVTDVTC